MIAHAFRSGDLGTSLSHSVKTVLVKKVRNLAGCSCP